MVTSPPALRRFRILVAIDTSEYAEIVLEHAIDQAARHERPDLHFVTVVDSEADTERARAPLAGLALQGLDTMRTKGSDWRSWVHVRAGIAEDEIAELASEIRAALLVIGRFGVHHRRGSTADRVLDLAPCPVLVVNLKQDVVEVEQCRACVEVRAQTGAEQLFCAEHGGDRGLSLRVYSSTLTRGGSVW